MTISVIRKDMTSDEKPECSHEFNFFLDRQLQTKLLEQDEILYAAEHYSLQNLNNNEKGKNVIVKNDTIQGWNNESKVVLRKPEKENAKQSNPVPPWRDRNKQIPMMDTYVFKHYGDIHGYIEQYRRDHLIGFGYKSHSALERMQGDGARKFGSSQSPSQIHLQQQNACNCGAPPSSSDVQKYITAALHYTNRSQSTIPGHSNSPNQIQHGHSAPTPSTSQTQTSHICTKHNHGQKNNQAYKYKLSPDCGVMWTSRTESQNSERANEVQSPRLHSAKVYPSGKHPTKVSVPTAPNGHVKRPPITVQNNQSKNTEAISAPNNGVRTLDTLACVATDKQKRRPLSSGGVTVRMLGQVLSDARGRSILRPSTVSSNEFFQHQQQNQNKTKDVRVSETPKSERVELDIGASVSEDEEDVATSEDSDAISMSRLSTACLGADVKVKQDSTKLEPSCTYHIFPNEQMLDNSVTVLTSRSMTWYPSISTPPQTKGGILKKDLTFHGPFRESMPEISLAVAECFNSANGPRLARTRSDSKIDFPMIKDGKGMLVATDVNIGDQAKLESENESTPRNQGSDIEIETPRIMSMRESKTKLMKNLRKKYSGFISKGTKQPQQKQNGSDCRSSASLTSDRTAYSVKIFPNSGTDLKDNFKIQTAVPVMQYWKTDGKSEHDGKSAVSQRSNRQREADEESMMKVAEYLLRDSNIIGCSSRQDQLPGLKHGVPMAEGMENPPSLKDLTWCEKLELLRSVNKPKDKPRVKMPRLKYIKDISEPIPLVREPSRAHLYEQRRIKHLLQQARMKGKRHMEFLNSQNVQRSSGSESDISDDASDEGKFSIHRKDQGVSYEDGVFLDRYNVKQVIKGTKTIPILDRTNTEVMKD